MKKTFLVLINELKTTVLRKSFIITLLLFPAIGLIVTLLIGNKNQTSGITSLLSEMVAPEKKVAIIGISDQAGIINAIPDEFKDEVFLTNSEDKGLQELKANKISALYSIPSDYIENGEITVYQSDFNPLSASNDNHLIETIINLSLLSNHPDIQKLAISYPEFAYQILAPEPQRDPGSQLTFFIPYIVTFLFYIIILTSASLMLNSVTKEKSNRVIEILLTSISPEQLLSGKIVALGLVGLLQTVVWTGSGYFILQMSGKSFSLPSVFLLPPSFLIWGIVFFICGYLLYASFMAGVGALVANIREASQATILIVIPMVIPLALIAPIIESPNGNLATILSIFPLTAPVTMMTRLAAGPVPFWEIILAIILLFISIFWVTRSISRLFRAQYLLSGKEFKIKFLFNALFGRN